MNVLHFDDDRINEILSGETMTKEERDFLIADTVRFEECTLKKTELEAMSDADLMSVAYSIWADYAR